MVKIRAKQIVSGKALRLFGSLLFSFAVSLLGVAAIGLTFFAFDSKKVNLLFLRFGSYSFYVKVALAVIICFIGLILLSNGKKRSTLSVCRTVSDNSFSGEAKKSFSFLLYLGVKILFALCWSFVYLLPFFICLASLLMSLSQGPLEKNVFTAWASGCAVLLIIGIAFLFVTLQRYSAWRYYLCFHKYGVIPALYKSLEKTEDRCVKIALFKLSMLGWILSCLLLLPIVYVWPYYSVSTAYYILKGANQEDESDEEEKRFTAVFEIIREQ
jgi:hypothetical protein